MHTTTTTTLTFLFSTALLVAASPAPVPVSILPPPPQAVNGVAPSPPLVTIRPKIPTVIVVAYDTLTCTRSADSKPHDFNTISGNILSQDNCFSPAPFQAVQMQIYGGNPTCEITAYVDEGCSPNNGQYPAVPEVRMTISPSAPIFKSYSVRCH